MSTSAPIAKALEVFNSLIIQFKQTKNNVLPSPNCDDMIIGNNFEGGLYHDKKI